MKLTIGMIVKNEAAHLRKCLECLQPVLEQVDSELIIVDTGSTDNTAEIAAEFTPHVLHVEWKNNFAAARNATLKAAQGEWYMYLDADECFQSVDDIIRFFNSGEYKQYNCASHYIKNYTDDSTFTVMVALRLFKRTKHTQFTGIIHEYIPGIEPQKYLEDTSEHTGYLYEDNSEKKAAKHKRNIDLLLLQLEQNPRDLRALAHTVKQFESQYDEEKTEEYINRGLEMVRNKPQDFHFHFFHKHAASLYSRLNDPEKTIRFIEGYIAKCKEPVTTFIDMYSLLGEQYSKIKDYAKAAKYYEKSLETRYLYDKKQLNIIDLNMDILVGIMDGWEESMIAFIIDSYKQMEDWISVFDWVARSKMDNAKVLPLLVEIIDVSGRFEKIVDLYQRIKPYEISNKDIYYDLLNQFDHLMIKSANTLPIIRALADENVGFNDDYIRLQRLRLAHATNQSPKEIADMLQYFLTEQQGPTILYCDVMVIALKNNVDFTTLLLRTDVDDVHEFITSLLYVHPDFPHIFLNYLQTQPDNCFTAGPKASFWMVSMCDQLLKKKTAFTDDQKLYLFKVYTQHLYSYAQTIYAPTAFCDEGIELLPGAYRFGYYMHKADMCLETGDQLGYVRRLREALHHNKSMRDMVSLLINRFKAHQSEKEIKAKNARNELNQYTAALKKSIMQLIENNMFEKAKEVLVAYEQINPTDSEIEKLKALLK